MARVLERHGYAAATTNRIAETAGVSVGTLYEYFPNNEAVFDALIQQEIESLVRAIQDEGLDPDAPLDETLGRILTVAKGALRHGPEFIRSLEQVPDAVFRRRLAGAPEAVIGRRGSRCPGSSRNEVACGLPMDRARAGEPSTATMSGPMTSSSSARTMDDRCGC